MKTIHTFPTLFLAAFLMTAAAPLTVHASALHLDGIDDSVRISNGTINLANSSFSIEFWARRSAINAAFDPIFGGGTSQTANQHLLLGFRNNNVFTFAFWNNDLNTPAAYTDDLWHHYACTYNTADRSRRIYVDGAQVTNDTATANYQGAASFMTIGLDLLGPSYFHGDLDEMRFWNTVRTPAEIQSNRVRRLQGSESGLLAYYRFDEINGATAVDSSGHGITGQLSGGPTWNPAFDAVQIPIPASRPATSVGQTNATLNVLVNTNGLPGTNRFAWGPGAMALGLDGVSDEVVINHTAGLDPYPFTVATWVKIRSGGDSGIINKYVGSSGNGWNLFIAGGLLHAWYFRDGSNCVFDGAFGINGGNISDGQWHFVAFTVDASGGKVYVDGLAVGSLPWTGTPGATTTATPVRFGNYAGARLAQQLDEVSVWNVALTQSAITNLMAAPITPAHPNYASLRGYWKLDEGKERIAMDSSPNGNHGTFLGKPTWMPGERPNLTQLTAPQNVTGTNAVLALDGVDDYAAAPSGVWFNGNFTVEGWVFARSYNNWSRLIDFGNGGYVQEVYLALSAGVDGFPTMGVFNTGNTPLVSSSQRLPLNQWTHLAATVNGGIATIYFNGVVVGTGPITVPQSFTRNINYIGRSLFGGDGYANALFEDIRIWNSAISPDVIRQWMNKPVDGSHPSFTSLQANWRFDEAGGTIALDSSPFARSATLFNGAVRVPSNPVSEILTNLVPGTIYSYQPVSESTNGTRLGPVERMATLNPGSGGALRFDGYDDLVRVAGFMNNPVSVPITTEVTIEFWQKARILKDQSTFSLDPDLISGGATRIQAHVPAANGGVYFDFGTYNPPGRISYIPPDSIVGSWQHFALVAKSGAGGFMRILRNGMVVAEQNTSAPFTPGVYALVLGSLAGGYYFDGQLDEFRVWNVARTTNEIAQNFNVSLNGNEPGLVTYFRMDEGGGNTLIDSSSRGINGILLNGTDRVGSGAPVALPVATTQPAILVSEGNATLKGLVKGNGSLPTTYWFEYGQGVTPVPNSAENTLSLFNIGSGLSSLTQVNFGATPTQVQSFTNISNRDFAGTWPGGPVDYFAARYTGRIYIPESGAWTFTTSSDDGSQVFIDGQSVVLYDGIHGGGEISANLYLQAGYHQIEARYFENNGGAFIEVSFAGPGVPRQIIPASAFLRYDPLYSAATSPQVLPAGLDAQGVTALITNLPVGTSNHFRLVVANANGTNYGGDQMFTMLHPGAQTAMAFDGVNDYAQVNITAFPNFATNLTLEAWIRPQAPYCNTIISRGTGLSPNSDFIFTVGFDGTNCGVMKLAFFGAGRWDTSASLVPLDTWTHVAVVFDGTKKSFYINGVLDRTVAILGSLFQSAPTEPFWIGRQGSQAANNFFAGSMDEVRVWNVARSAADIADAFNRGLSGSESGLLAYYRFDEPTGSTFLDSGRFGLNAISFNGPTRVFSGAGLFKPIATTLPATPVLATTATLRGTINPGGASSVAYFEYGTSTAFGSSTPPQSVGVGISTLPYTSGITNLDPGTTYYYRLVGLNSSGTNFGGTQLFTTLVLGSGWPVATKPTGGLSGAPRHVTDKDGNIYLSGQFSGSATFKSTLLPIGGSTSNAFVGKIARGADWSSAIAIGSDAAGSALVRGLVANASGELYVVGQFSGVATLGTNILTSAGSSDVFVAKLAANGTNWLWAKRFGSTGGDVASSVTLGTNGNLYVAGQFSGSIDFGNGTTVRNSAGNTDVFVAKFAPDGTALWSAAGGGIGIDSVAAVVTDASDFVYLAGQFVGTATFGSTILNANGGGTDVLVGKLNSSGTWVLARRAGAVTADAASGLAIDTAGQLYLAGQFGGTADYDGVLSNLNTGSSANTFVLKLNSQLSVIWYAQGGPGNPGEIAVDSAGGFVYLTGDFTISTQFGSTPLISSGNGDVFVVQLGSAGGDWKWVRKIGATGNEIRGSVSVDPAGSVVVSGSFQNSIQIGFVVLATANAQDIFVARLDSTSRYEHNNWTIGQAVPVPLEAQDPNRTDGGAIAQPVIGILETEQGDSDSGNSFVWSEAEHKLYSVRPVSAALRWPLTADATNTTKVIIAVGRTLWPVHPQIHIARAPVDLEPAMAGFPYKFLTVSFQTGTGASVDGTTKQFNATNSGYSVIQFLATGGVSPDPSIHPSKFEVVRTVFWNDPAYLSDNVPAVIGTALQHPDHNDPTGKNGYVFYERAFYDGAGNDRAHDRDTRTGPIIPVNRDTASPTDDLLVIWYHTNTVTGIAWADDPVRYIAAWPVPPAQIVIASRLGTGPLDVANFPSKQVYNQPDATLPGYNPNEEHAALYGDTVYALRNDLNDLVTPRASEPYTLVKYRDPASSDWAMLVYQVVMTNAIYRFEYPITAGQEIAPPTPMNLLPLAGSTNTWIAGPVHKDYVGRLYARGAGPGSTGTNIITRFWYPLQPGFFYDLNRDGTPDATIGTFLPLLDRRPGGVAGTPINITYNATWPTQVPTLQIGETLINAKFGLPGIRDFASVKVIFDQANPLDTNALSSLVRIFDPLSSRTLQLRPNGSTSFVSGNGFGVFRIDSTSALLNGIATSIDPASGLLVFSDLPFVIRSRLRYDPLNKNLIWNGLLDESALYGGPDNPLVLINVLSPRERDRIKALDGVGATTDFDRMVDALYDLSRNPNGLDLNRDNIPDKDLLIGLQYEVVTNRVGNTTTLVTNIVHEKLGDLPKAMTAGGGSGSGYLTIVENDNAALNNLPITLYVIRVDDGPFRGDLKVIYPDNVFDEKLTFRHSGDFGGEPQKLEFEWYYAPDYPGFVPTDLPIVNTDGTIGDFRGWLNYSLVPPGINGANDITFGDGGFSSLLTISDNWVICRYRGYSINGTNKWSEWVGSPGGGRAQLAEGWIKRVINGLNPFEARSKDFHLSPSVTYASMLEQAGGRYEGPIAFNPSADNLNKIGLISSYETVLQRGRNLSIDANLNYAPANNALLLAAGRVADFYMLLGNEAYSDAADPTIGFRTDGTGYGTLAPSIFTFQNQLDSLLEEELCLLRGRDDRSAPVQAPPVYNRLFWNFTKSDGEVAYAQTYNITDQNGDGLINAEDARIMYPQGHGDAWGHYLTAITKYYDLLRNQNFTWIPRTENILLAGVPVEVDYLDERKFASAAAAKAKTGAEIADLTYRINYVDDPTGQFQGYKDTDSDRAWGLSEWARRAGQGAYFDWVTANAILPATDPNTNHVGIQKIDRTTVLELAEITSAYQTVQDQLDKADAGLNPLGLAKNAVPFDIDPVQITSGKTHFEQIYDRAISAMNNAISVFNHANQLSTALRSLQDTVNDFSRNVDQQERDYKNRLIEIFGYPYAGEIGPGRTYPSGYDGPDLYHYMYVNTTDLNGQSAVISGQVNGFFSRFENLQGRAGHYFSDDVQAQDNPALSTLNILPVTFPVSIGDWAFQAPTTWGQRRAPGQLQQNISDVLQSQARLKQALFNYDNLIKQIDDAIDLLEAREQLGSDISDLNDTRNSSVSTLKGVAAAAKIARQVVEEQVETKTRIAEAVVEGVPKVVGLANDAMSGMRAGILIGNIASTKVFRVVGGILEGVEEQAKTSIAITTDVTANKIDTANRQYETAKLLKEVEQLIRDEAPARTEILALGEKVNQNIGAYQASLAKGLRLIDERISFRKDTAAETQSSRYQDMTFRVFRNDAIQKYRAQFDLAARYVFLAATAYDFETQLLGGSSGAGREFMTDIIRQRSLGQVENGVPIAGRHGLADPLARLNQNFAVLKGQLGFNNPQTETGRFSVRRELLRIDDAHLPAWRTELKKRVVANLWDVPEFRRYCRPFAPESAGPQPGLVLRFPTTVTFGLNYFSWPLGGGDNAYDPTVFATKVRSAGVWFENYLSSGLSVTPRVYLVPVGSDIMRSPSGNTLEIREWRVVDQKLPVPFPIGFTALNSASWIPQNDTLSDTFGDIRKFSSFRAYHDSGLFTPAETVSDSRLIGRSVWNTDWMLIIPGGTFLFDPNQGLDTFINSVSDIKIFFQTYSYSGN